MEALHLPDDDCPEADHGQGDNHGGPTDNDRYDAAERDLIQYIRKHHAVIDNLDAHVGRECHVLFADGYDTVIRVRTAHGGTRRIPLDSPGDGW